MIEYPEQGQDVGIEKRRPYSKPAILHELELETRAGTPNPEFRDPFDPLGIYEDGT